ncbi:G5P family DNA-binding protein [Marilutibacter chinensis]|uniref:Single-stranded DNA-binding protein n=1 Tax=Marilutibacter chinensis TaxID=2912247 RepID=A0ABS9HN11_9GAMM|nr:G5P family DNA-binding protein [Lysobacter chinensis]MCF7220396.1 G5P family DNA-binding protein [Lysobacter chinensis]
MNMHVRVVIQSTNTNRPSEFKGRRYGWQNAAIFNGGDFPLPFGVHVELGHEYPPGEYTIDPVSYQLDERGNLRLKGIKLLPVGGNSKAAKAT